jgi:hypothetical protein
MSKNVIIACVVALVVVLAGVFAWRYFSKTNSVTSQQNAGVNAKSSEKLITAFTFSELGSKASEAIDSASHTVTVVVPSGTDIKKLTPAISLSDSATISPDYGITQDFTKPIVYTVTAQDGSAQSYTVTVKVATPQGFGGS